MTPERRQILTYGIASAAAAGAVIPLAGALYPRIRDADLPATDLADLPSANPFDDAFTPHARADEVRRAFVHNQHTGETLNAVYYENGAYVPQALHAAMKVLRDWRSGQEHFMDPRLFDLLHHLRKRVEVHGAFQIMSGYRSATTNAWMRRHSQEVAEHSQHVLGKALDIGLEGVDLSRLHRAALSLRAGGVGFYPNSGFVHVDVGPVRQWVET